MNRRQALSVLGTLVPVLASSAALSGQRRGEVREEAAEHPRIAAAIRALDDAIDYMEKAPHDFGGHKAAAIRASRAAIVELRRALAYRARRERPRQ